MQVQAEMKCTFDPAIGTGTMHMLIGGADLKDGDGNTLGVFSSCVPMGVQFSSRISDKVYSLDCLGFSLNLLEQEKWENTETKRILKVGDKLIESCPDCPGYQWNGENCTMGDGGFRCEFGAFGAKYENALIIPDNCPLRCFVYRAPQKGDDNG